MGNQSYAKEHAYKQDFSIVPDSEGSIVVDE
jgi:hypothetical protein